MSAATNDVLDKVQKLLRLAGSGEANEAAVALQMAQRLMAQHNLTQADVEVGRLVSLDLRSTVAFAKVKDWELRLVRGVTEAFGVGLMYRRGRSGSTTKGPNGRQHASFVLIGTKTESELALYCAEVLQRQLARAATKYARTIGISDRVAKSAEVDSYCRGWVATALTKVTPLVPSKARQAAIEAAIAARAGGRDVKVQGRVGSVDAQQAGAQDALEVELNRPMGGTAPAQLGGGR